MGTKKASNEGVLLRRVVAALALGGEVVAAVALQHISSSQIHRIVLVVMVMIQQQIQQAGPDSINWTFNDPLFEISKYQPPRSPAKTPSGDVLSMIGTTVGFIVGVLQSSTPAYKLRPKEGRQNSSTSSSSEREVGRRKECACLWHMRRNLTSTLLCCRL